MSESKALVAEPKKTLVDLDRDQRMLLDAIEAGEFTSEEGKELLDKACTDLCEKCDSYGIIEARLKAAAAFWKEQKESCYQAEKTFSNAVERLRERMRYVLAGRPDQMLQGQFYRYFLSPSKDTLVIDEDKLPNEFKITHVELIPDKALIEKELKAGKEISGACLKTGNTSLRSGKPKI